MTSRSAVITGGGIAGPAAAFWLRRYGWDVTVIERAPEPRRGGQNVDIRGTGRDVLQAMGLEAAVRARNTGEQGTRFVTADGQVVAEFGIDGDDGPTAELEILRGDLAELLHEETAQAGVRYRFGETVEEVDELDDGVEVRLSGGDRERHDLLIVAEGIHAPTRTLVFGEQRELRRLGAYMAWLTIPRRPDDVDWWLWFNAPGRRVATLRPDNHGTLRATLSFMSADEGLERLPAGEQAELLRSVFAGAGWQTERIIQSAADGDLYLEAIAQVHTPTWVRGRVVLLGDAACATSPVAGFGTSLALVGAYLLAGELAAVPDPDVALRRYETLMRPHAKQAQSLPPGTPGLAHPRSAAGVGAFRLGLRAAAGPLGQRVGSLMSGASRRQKSPPLPRYLVVGEY